MYDTIPKPPDEPETPDEYEERDRIRDQIDDAVEEVLSVDEWETDETVPIGHARQTVTATIPFHVTAYRHDVDDDAPARVRRRHETDGWVDLDGQSETYVTSTFRHRYETHVDAPGEPPDNADQILSLQADTLAGNVYAALRDGEVTRTIREEVEVREEEEDDPVGWVEDEEDVEPTAEHTFTLTTKDVAVGTARYRAVGIVPPGDFFE